MSDDQSFAERFMACMAEANIKLDQTTIEDASFFGDAVSYVKSWFDELDDKAKEVVDAATEIGEPVAVHLSEVNVAPGVPDLMADFDENPGWQLSTLLDWCLHCIDEAQQADG